MISSVNRASTNGLQEQRSMCPSHAVNDNGSEFLVGDSEMARLIRSRDWSKTPLGHIGRWPQSLRTTVSLCLASNFPINIIWGPQHTQIYNDGYRVVCGEGHPAFLGMDYSKSWESAWPAIGEPFARALAGETTYLENQRMFLNRNGYLEETFFTFSTSPIRDESGGIGGLFHPVTETTATMVGERRTRALRDLTARLGDARATSDVFDFAIKVLEGFDFDLPFTLLYEIEPDHDAYRLRAHFGFRTMSNSCPETLTQTQDLPWPIRALVASSTTHEISGLSQTFDSACGPYEENPDIAFLVPIVSPGMTLPQAIMIAGASSRLPMDDLYRGFYELIGAALAAALTKVQAMERERQRLEAMAAIDHAKTAFFSNVSHEFRTPLTLLLGPLEELIATANPDGAERKQLDLAQRNGLRLLKLVNSLLDFSRIEAGRSQGSFEPTDLAAVTADLASNFRSATEKAGLQLIVDCPPLTRDVYVDREMWEKIVLNLMSNAFKFTLEGSITVLLKEVGNGVEFSVRDTGVGIPQAELPRVFERFHRIEGQKGRTHEGTGIGLALVDELVKLHGGAIAAESWPGAGATFRVFVPFGFGHLKPEQIGKTRTQVSTAVKVEAFVAEALRWLPDDDEATGPLAGTSDSPFEKARIVLADDNADMRGYVANILRAGGYEVATVENGRAALDEISDGPEPDLIVTDVMMPEMDGFQLLESLRANPATAGIPVILLSARAGEEARVEGLAAGADDYLVKPFSARELRARIDGVVNLSRQRKELAARERELHAQLATERGRAALQLSEARLQFALDAGRLGAWEMDMTTRLVVRSALHDRIFGYETPREIWNMDTFIGHVLAEDRDMIAAGFRKSLATHEPWHFECRIRRTDGERRWIEVYGGPAPDVDGSIKAMAGVIADITERKNHEEQQKTLVNELNHRVKNTLSTVQSLVMQTRRSVDNAETFGAAMENRILALSQAHDLLTKSSWIGASLRDVVLQTLTAHFPGSAGERRISVAGPAIRLSPNAAVSLNMAFHELATNAVKYGALSNRHGVVTVTWAVNAATHPAVVEILWVENGGPPVAPPSHRGFGSRLIERGLSRELDGEISLIFDPAGVLCRLDLPVSSKLELLA